MNGMLNENFIVEEYEFNNPIIQKIDSVIDGCIRDGHQKYFHTFDHICVFDNILKNFSNNETVNFTFSDKSMASYELSKKLTIARENGFIFNLINEVTLKIYSTLSHIHIHYYLKLRIPIMHRQFFRKVAQNPE